MEKVQGRMRAFGLISWRRKGFLSHILTKLSLDAADSNSTSSAGLSKMETLRTVRDGGGGTSPSGVVVKLSIQSLKVWRRLRCSSIDLLHGSSFSFNGPF